MGGPYNIPRNYKGESKILFIFSIKAFITTAVGLIIGTILYYLFNLLTITIVGVVCLIICGVIGFVIGAFKIPESNNFEITRKTGGEDIDKVILRWIKFKRNKGKIYIYKEEVQKDVK